MSYWCLSHVDVPREVTLYPHKNAFDKTFWQYSNAPLRFVYNDRTASAASSAAQISVYSSVTSPDAHFYLLRFFSKKNSSFQVQMRMPFFGTVFEYCSKHTGNIKLNILSFSFAEFTSCMGPRNSPSHNSCMWQPFNLKTNQWYFQTRIASAQDLNIVNWGWQIKSDTIC